MGFSVMAICWYCGVEFSVPVSREWRDHCCSGECKMLYRKRKIAAGRERRTRYCRVCGTQFIARDTQIRSGGGVYCSMDCLHKSRSGVHFTPEHCAAISNAMKRSEKHAASIRRGASNTQYKERSIRGGYPWVWVDGVKVAEHRYIAEKSLGRALGIDEVVHHLDGDRQNNDTANLAIMSRAEHIAIHRGDLANGKT